MPRSSLLSRLERGRNRSRSNCRGSSRCRVVFCRGKRKEKLVPARIGPRGRSKRTRQVRGDDPTIVGQGLEERGSTFGSSNSYVNVNYPIVSDATRIDPVSLSLSLLHRFPGLDFSWPALTSPLPSRNNNGDKTARKTVGTSPPQITQITLAWSWPTARVIHQPPRTTSLPAERRSPRLFSALSLLREFVTTLESRRRPRELGTRTYVARR